MNPPVSETTELQGPVVIIGAGLIGASVGCALTAAGIDVRLSDRNPAHAQVAAGRGAGSVDPVDPDEVAVVVAAVPPAALVGVIMAALAQYPNAYVTDVGSVKHRILIRLREQGADLSRYVGSHPMAGSHLSGPISANEDLFADRTWIVAPHEGSTPGAVDTVTALARTCRARVVRMGTADHDRAVAEVSHLPQVVSSVLASGLTGVAPAHLAIAGQGLRDTTRIAGSDPGLWQQILLGNREEVAQEVRRFRARLDDMLEGLEAGYVEPQLAAGVAGTLAIPGKHGGRHEEYARFIVQIPDEQGALARLFVDADRAGVSIEDISIEHDPVKQVGWLSLAVVPEGAERLEKTMTEAGWEIQPPD